MCYYMRRELIDEHGGSQIRVSYVLRCWWMITEVFHLHLRIQTVYQTQSVVNTGLQSSSCLRMAKNVSGSIDNGKYRNFALKIWNDRALFRNNIFTRLVTAWNAGLASRCRMKDWGERVGQSSNVIYVTFNYSSQNLFELLNIYRLYNARHFVP